MKPVPFDIPRLTEDGLAVLVGDRLYGDEAAGRHLDKLKKMSVPREMDALGSMLTNQSRLLALSAGSTQETIYDSYGRDLELLVRYRNAFKKTIDAAVRGRASSDDGTAQKFLDRATEEISEIVHEPTLDLGPDALKLAPAELCGRLQQQFRSDVESLKQNVAIWLHLLAEADYVSVVEWFNPKVLRYHFFRMDSVHQEVGRQQTTSGNFITGRTITTTVEKNVTTFNERRVHTVVNASSVAPDAYLRRVPERIAHLMNSIPAEVKPFVTIIDGMVSQEQIHRRLASSQIETETHSVYIPDPALALFNSWAINGWGGSTPEESRSLYRDHALAKANRWLFGELVGSFLLAAAAASFEGRRGAIVVGVICLTLTLFQQLGMRIENRRQ